MLTYLAIIATLITSTLAGIDAWQSPVYKYLFQFPLPRPPIKSPTKTLTSNGATIDYYEVNINQTQTQVYPDLGKTTWVGYDGVVPGPTFHMTKGREAIVRFINNGVRATSVHLHGSYSRAPFDGWANDTTEVGQYKDYYYPNSQNARTLWYHDHAIDHTAENAYSGLAGFYILHDDDELNKAGLPQGDYDVPLQLSAKRFNADGSLWSPEANGETVSVFGDVILVNGQPWPYLNVEPRKYRFRFLNGGISRSYQLYLTADTANTTLLPFTMVASDAGLLEKPVDTTQLDISIAERWEAVIDFSKYAGQNITFHNKRSVGADRDYPETDKVIRFVVANKNSAPNQRWDTETLPAQLRVVPYPPTRATHDRLFEFQSKNGGWRINGVGWSDGPEARVLAKPQRGAIEVWDLKNPAGGWTHPIHIHLVDFQIIGRTGGNRPVLEYEKVALKDVVWLNTNEQVTVIARYAPWDGFYMFHCHNLIHEDHEMMAAFNVTALTDLGYDEKTHFIDPMESRYRAVPFQQTDFSARSGPFGDVQIQSKVDFFTGLEAYKNVETVEAKLSTYWASHTTNITPTTLKTSTTKASTSKAATTTA